MPKFKSGDIVLVDGKKQEIKSWPSSDEGPFTTVYISKEGGEVWNTHWTGAVEIEGDPVYESREPELVAEGSGVVESTAGAIPSVEPEAEAEVTE